MTEPEFNDVRLESHRDLVPIVAVEGERLRTGLLFLSLVVLQQEAHRGPLRIDRDDEATVIGVRVGLRSLVLTHRQQPDIISGACSADVRAGPIGFKPKADRTLSAIDVRLAIGFHVVIAQKPAAVRHLQGQAVEARRLLDVRGQERQLAVLAREDDAEILKLFAPIDTRRKG